MQKKEKKRVFFGFDVETLWIDLPKEKKLIDEKMRHVTLLFIGEADIDEIKPYLSDIKKIIQDIFYFGFVGFFNKCLFLPKKMPRLVAFEVDFFNKNEIIKNFQEKIFDLFEDKFSLKEKNDFLAHITVARDHFNKDTWQKAFKLAPLYIKSLNLYESFENSIYNTLWKLEFLKPFEEIKHTADIAYIVRGKNYLDLLYNSFIALSFKSLDFLRYNHLLKVDYIDNIDDVIINLNEIVTEAEIDGIFLPFKAISFHSNIIEEKNILNWEMIVDV